MKLSKISASLCLLLILGIISFGSLGFIKQKSAYEEAVREIGYTNDKYEVLDNGDFVAEHGITFESEESIKAASKLYRKAFGNKILKKSKKQLNKIKNQKSNIETLIENIDENNPSENSVTLARKAYDEAFIYVQKEVKNYDKLTECEGKIADNKTANSVIDMINSLGEITLESKDKINNIKEHFDNLTDAQKQLVTNKNVLKEAEDKYDALEKEHKQILAQEKAKKLEEQRRAEEERIKNSESYNLPVPLIYQNPELPNGCEVTSLSMVMNYKGYSCDKCDLADNYLPKGEGDPNSVYIGNPRDDSGYYCFTSPLQQTVNNFNAAKGTSIGTRNLTGQDISVIYNEVRNGNPVIVWVTLNYKAPYSAGGFYQNLHCTVLSGWDLNSVYTTDPIYGKKKISKSKFEKIWKQMGCRALVLD
ncbi:MAG: C39 family peptidase [Lachnospiraceae bacterium]|nr:C39 family peptidase [Lachnospiraceae bacterium]